jgi:predicted negative regulator of RcsB-dependent stress response
MATLTAWFASSSFTLVLGVLALAVIGLQGWLVWRLIQALGSAARMEEKLGHFGDALSLLTETTETGFVALANELSKQSGDSLLSKPKTISNARINAAARRGSSVSEIAASEQLSESEVRLRMHLSKAMAPASKAADKAPRSARKPPVRKSALPVPVSEEQVHGALRA